jgi:hypothetical protein
VVVRERKIRSVKVALVSVSAAGSSIDGAEIVNASSESTLRELLSVAQSIRSRLGKTASGGGTGLNNVSSAAKSASDDLNRLVGATDKLKNSTDLASMAAADMSTANKKYIGSIAALGNIFGVIAGVIGTAISVFGDMSAAVIKFGGFLLDSDNTLSGFALRLSEVTAQIPLVGTVISALLDGFTALTRYLEETRDALTSISEVGGGFSSDLMGLRKSAAAAGLSVGEFAGVVRSHSQALSVFGSVETGARKLGEASKLVRIDLLNMGFSLDQISNELPEALSMLGQGAAAGVNDFGKLTLSASGLIKELDLMASLTGQSRTAQAEALRKQTQNAAFQIKLAGMDTERRAQVLEEMARMQAQFGEVAAEAIKVRLLGLAPMSRELRSMYATMPGAVDEINRFTDAVAGGRIAQQQNADELDRVTVKAVASALRSGKNLEGVLRAAAAGVGGTAADVASNFNTLVQNQYKFLNRDGTLKEQSFKDELARMRQEKSRADQRLQLLNTFEEAMRRIKSTMVTYIIDPLMTRLGPVMSSMSDRVQEVTERFFKGGAGLTKVTDLIVRVMSNLPNILEHTVFPALVWFTDFITDTVIPTLIRFVNYLFSDEFKQTVKDAIDTFTMVKDVIVDTVWPAFKFVVTLVKNHWGELIAGMITLMTPLITGMGLLIGTIAAYESLMAAVNVLEAAKKLGLIAEIPALGAMAGAVWAAVAPFATLVIELGAVLLAVGAVSLAIGAVILALKYLYDNGWDLQIAFEEFKIALEATWGFIKKWGPLALGPLGVLFKVLRDNGWTVSMVFDTVRDSVEKFGMKIMEIIDGLLEKLPSWAGGLSEEEKKNRQAARDARRRELEESEKRRALERSDNKKTREQEEKDAADDRDRRRKEQAEKRARNLKERTEDKSDREKNKKEQEAAQKDKLAEITGKRINLGLGITAPEALNSAESGGTVQATSQADLRKMGFKIQQGDVQGGQAGLRPSLLKLAKDIQENLPGFSQFTSFNDKFHQERAPRSHHTQGLALDFVLTKPPTEEEGQKIISVLKQMGSNFVIDEYNHPSGHATGGHIHAEVPAAREGGIFDGPSSGYPVMLHGKEMVVPSDQQAVSNFLNKINSVVPTPPTVEVVNNTNESLLTAMMELVDLQNRSVKLLKTISENI